MSEAGELGTAGGCGDLGRPRHTSRPLGGPPRRLRPGPASVPSRVRGQPAGCGRAEAAGGVRRRQEGAGGSGAAGRKRRTHRPPSAPRVSTPDPAMWGLLLVLAAFAPAVGVGLGAPGASVLGLAPPATTEAPGSTPAPRSSPAQPPAGKDNGELQSRGPASRASRLPYSPVSCVMTLPQHVHTHTDTLSLSHSHTHTLTPYPAALPPTAMAADSAAPVPSLSQQSWDRNQWDAFSPSPKPSLFTDEKTENGARGREERERVDKGTKTKKYRAGHCRRELEGRDWKERTRERQGERSVNTCLGRGRGRLPDLPPF